MAVSTTTPVIGQQSTSQISSNKGLLGKDDFLKLMLTQLRYQDPLNPMEGTEFATQLAQFSSVEQLSNINTNITQSIDATQILSQAIGNALSATLIGKEVKASGEQFAYSGTGDVRLGYSLSGVADKVAVRVVDSYGATVRTLSSGGGLKGDNEVLWDGKNDQGGSVAAGQYKLVVKASDADGNAVTTTPFVFGHVTSVRFKATGTVFVVDGMEIPISKILEVLNG
jgi:flagellar basal-body rod modification protein FlgD